MHASYAFQTPNEQWSCTTECILFFLLLCLPLALCCNHKPLLPDKVGRVYVESFNERNRRDIHVASTYENLRIHVTYDVTVSSLPLDKQQLLKESIMSKAVSYWQSALKTRRTSQPLRLARACLASAAEYARPDDKEYYCMFGCDAESFCGDSLIPEEHLQGCRYYNKTTKTYVEEDKVTAGAPDADFLLYVAANETDRCKSSVAYASYCQLEVEYDRPVAGFVNFCPNELSVHESKLESAIATVKHEMLHALGFSVSLFGLFRDQDGNPLTARTAPGGLPPKGPDLLYSYSDRVAKTVRRYNWTTVEGPISWDVDMIVTPKVTEEVRRHFNCSALEGAELENQGPSGTRLTHWEKRVFENELMTGVYTQNPVASRITLAFMEDTGWYKANYSYAEPLEWGYNLGCDFVTRSCYDWISRNTARQESIHPYCTDTKSSVLRTYCTMRRNGMAVCNLQTYDQNLPMEYRFSEAYPKSGGRVEIADYCPYLQEFSWRQNQEYVRGSDCLLSSNTPADDVNFAIEYYGPDSKCFEQGQPFQISRCQSTFVSNNYGAGCYQYRCTEQEGLVIIVNKRLYRCYKGGQILKVMLSTNRSYHEGTLVCPTCSEICKSIISKCPAESEPPVEAAVPVVPVPCASSALLGNIFLVLFCSIIWIFIF